MADEDRKEITDYIDRVNCNGFIGNGDGKVFLKSAPSVFYLIEASDTFCYILACTAASSRREVKIVYYHSDKGNVVDAIWVENYGLAPRSGLE